MQSDANKEKLIEKRDQLRQRLEAIKKDHQRGLDKDLDDQAIELENAEVLNEIERVTALELESIEDKLRAFQETS